MLLSVEKPLRITPPLGLAGNGARETPFLFLFEAPGEGDLPGGIPDPSPSQRHIQSHFPGYFGARPDRSAPSDSRPPKEIRSEASSSLAGCNGSKYRALHVVVGSGRSQRHLENQVPGANNRVWEIPACHVVSQHLCRTHGTRALKKIVIAFCNLLCIALYPYLVLLSLPCQRIARCAF